MSAFKVAALRAAGRSPEMRGPIRAPLERRSPGEHLPWNQTMATYDDLWGCFQADEVPKPFELVLAKGLSESVSDLVLGRDIF